MHFLISIQNWGLYGCFSGALCEMPWLLCEREGEVGKKVQFCGLNPYYWTFCSEDMNSPRLQPGVIGIP